RGESLGDAQQRRRSGAVVISAVPDTILDRTRLHAAGSAPASGAIRSLDYFAFSIADVIVMRAESHIGVLQVGIGPFHKADPVPAPPRAPNPPPTPIVATAFPSSMAVVARAPSVRRYCASRPFGPWAPRKTTAFPFTSLPA